MLSHGIFYHATGRSPAVSRPYTKRDVSVPVPHAAKPLNTVPLPLNELNCHQRTWSLFFFIIPPTHFQKKRERRPGLLDVSCALVAAEQGGSAVLTGRLRLLLQDELSRISVSRTATPRRHWAAAGRRCIVFAHPFGALTDVNDTAAIGPAFDHASLPICRPVRQRRVYRSRVRLHAQSRYSRRAHASRLRQTAAQCSKSAPHWAT